MNRRDFVTLIGAAAALAPMRARAQKPAMPVIGFLHAGSSGAFTTEMSGFRQGLKETGFVEGESVSIEYRWAEGRSERLPALAADLVAHQVAVIAAIGGDVTALAAKAATAAIPIVFLNGSDPIKSGLVTSINRPGANITGVSLFAGTVDGKRLDLLHELVPQATTIAVLNNALVAETGARSKALTDAAATIGLRLVFFDIASDADFETAFKAIAEQRIGAMFVSGSPYFLIQRGKIIPVAARQHIPTIYAWRENPAEGGLASYGASIRDSSRQAGIYTGRILGGARPADLPVMQPTKFEFVINLKAAKALGLDVPPRLLVLADETIE